MAREARKLCVVCSKIYPADMAECPDDGTALVLADADATASPAGRAFGVGSFLGSYRLTRLIGEGGVGNVFEAEHTRLGRKMAIKVLHPDLATRVEVTRFFNEARAVNEIRHANILDIEDFVAAKSGPVYLLMELLVGKDLHELLGEEAPLDPDRVVHIGAQIADALGAVHRVGIVHRDLKPDNIFLTEQDGDPDFVKVLDFGIAKFTTDDTGLTKAGTTLGTPEYMAPEQILPGREIDTRTDVYALGMVLYQALTGRPAFSDPAMVKVFRAHCYDPVPPPSERLGSQLPPAVEAAVMKCLEKAPENRFASMEELRDALLLDAPAPVSVARGGSAELKLPAGAPSAGRRRVKQLLPALAMAAAAAVLQLIPAASRPARGSELGPVQTPAVAPRPAEPEGIPILLVSKPDKAELFLGKERKSLGVAPREIRVPLGSDPIDLVARFADGSEVIETVVPDRPPPPVVFVQPMRPGTAPPVAKSKPKKRPAVAAKPNKKAAVKPNKKAAVKPNKKPNKRTSREATIDPFQ